MGLSPSEFWSLSPHEFNVLAEAYKEKREEETLQLRSSLANLMWAAGAGHWKRGTEPKTFLDMLTSQGRKKKSGERMSPMEKARLNWIASRMNGLTPDHPEK